MPGKRDLQFFLFVAFLLTANGFPWCSKSIFAATHKLNHFNGLSFLLFIVARETTLLVFSSVTCLLTCVSEDQIQYSCAVFS